MRQDGSKKHNSCSPRALRAFGIHKKAHSLGEKQKGKSPRRQAQSGPDGGEGSASGEEEDEFEDEIELPDPDELDQAG